MGQSIQKLPIFYDDNDDDNDTHPPWIIVRVGMIFRRGQKMWYVEVCIYMWSHVTTYIDYTFNQQHIHLCVFECLGHAGML